MARLLALVLALLHPTFLAAAIDIGRERSIAPPGIGLGSAPGSQRDVVVATSGEESLVAWLDGTRGRTGAYVAVLSRDAAVVASSQRLLGADAFEVTITWTGSDYLALWKNPLGVMAATLDRNGTTISAPRMILPNARDISKVAWAGDRGMLLYEGQNSLDAAILDKQGNVLRSAIPITNQYVEDGRVASDGTSFFVFWRSYAFVQENRVDSISVTRLSVEGNVETSLPVWSGGQLLPSWDVAFDGQHFALALSQPTTDTQLVLHRVTVDASTLEATARAPVSLTANVAARIDWTGSYFVVFWMHHTGVRTRELRTLAFTANGPDITPVSVMSDLDPFIDADSAWNGRELVIVWTKQDRVSFDLDVVATTVTDTGHRKRAIVALSQRWQALGATATNGNESLIAWLEGGVDFTGQFTLISAHATNGVVDQSPLEHSTTARHKRPVIVFTGTMYLVLFLEIVDMHTPHIAMRRLDTLGIPLDAAPIHVAYGIDFGGAWNGTHLLVAYHSSGDIDSVRIAHDGTIVDPTPSKIGVSRSPSEMSVASNGTEFLLVWEEGYPQTDIHAARISAANFLLGAPINVASGASQQRHPAVASDGNDYAIVYMHDSTLTAKKVLRNGTLQNTTAMDIGSFIAHNPFSYTPPSIAATPTGFMVAWEHTFDVHAGEVWLARLNRDATVAEPPFAAVRSNLFEMQPALMSSSNGALELTYRRSADDPEYGAVMRIFLRRVEEAATRRIRSVRH